jgi:membrane protease YdiL (CAAX protease family)
MTIPADASVSVGTERTAVWLFLAGTFGWAWLLWGYWVVAMPPGGLQVSPAFILCAITGGLAPSLAALGVTYATKRGAAVARLLTPLVKWKIGWGPAALVLFLVPAATFVSVALQAFFVGPLQSPDPAILLMALVWPVLAALGEELGWRGFLLPNLAARWSLLPAAIATGVVWGVWHLPADYVALKGYGDWFFAAFLLNGPIVLTAHAVIMAWIWKRTSSTLAAVFYHLTITASAMVAPSSGAAGLLGVQAAACGAGVMCVIAVILVFLRREDFFAHSDRNQGATAT